MSMCLDIRLYVLVCIKIQIVAFTDNILFTLICMLNVEAYTFTFPLPSLVSFRFVSFYSNLANMPCHTIPYQTMACLLSMPCTIWQRMLLLYSWCSTDDYLNSIEFQHGCLLFCVFSLQTIIYVCIYLTWATYIHTDICTLFVYLQLVMYVHAG